MALVGYVVDGHHHQDDPRQPKRGPRVVGEGDRQGVQGNLLAFPHLEGQILSQGLQGGLKTIDQGPHEGPKTTGQDPHKGPKAIRQGLH